MEKKWRNLLLIVVLILLVIGVYILFSKDLSVSLGDTSQAGMESKINNVFAANNYSKNAFFSEFYNQVDSEKLMKLKKGFEDISVNGEDSNENALRDYYILASDLKLHEIEVIAQVEKYSLDENKYCEYTDEILVVDMNMSSLGSEYVGLKSIEDEYGLAPFVGSFDENRFVLTPELYDRFANYVFKVCASFVSGMGEEA